MPKWAFVVKFDTPDLRIPTRVGKMTEKRFRGAQIKTLPISCQCGHQLALWWEDYRETTLGDVLDIVSMEASRLNVQVTGCSFLGKVTIEALLVVAEQRLKLTENLPMGFSKKALKQDRFEAIGT